MNYINQKYIIDPEYIYLKFQRHKHLFKDDLRFDCNAIEKSLSIRDFDSQFSYKVLLYLSNIVLFIFFSTL